MSGVTVTRAHLLGLCRAADAVEGRSSIRKNGMIDGHILLRDLREWIAQASAAPEQEAVAWTWQGTLDRLKNGYCPEGEAVWPRKGPGVPIPLYTHPSAEIDRLRAELVESDKCVVRALNERDAALQKLAEAQALLRDTEAAFENGWYETHLKEIDAFLSATAQPADGVKP